MSSEAEQKAWVEKQACLTAGHDIANLLEVVKLASKAQDTETSKKAVEEITSIVNATGCVPESSKDKVKNSLEALSNFAKVHDQEGVRQASVMLASDLGARPVQERFPQFLGERRVKGYTIKVDGMPVATVKKAEMAQAFQATVDLNPNSKVEAEPVT